MSKGKKPNFFVVGAAKAGTTSIYHYLKLHNDIYLSPIKEPHYFSTDIRVEEFSSTYLKHTFLDLESYFAEKPYKELALSFVKDLDQYYLLFEDSKGETAIGECSPSYLYSKTAAKNIYGFNKDSKIIISLRNPIYRAFSHYLMALRIGQTSLSFREAFEKDLNEEEKGWGVSELFYELGLYSGQLQKYYDLFPKDQIKIILFDDLANDNTSTIKGIHKFLNVEDQNIEENKKYNSASVPKNPKLNRLMVKSGIKNFVGDLIGDEVKDKMKNVLFNEKDIPEISEDDINYLRELYKEDIMKTSEIIDKDLSFWLEE